MVTLALIVLMLFLARKTGAETDPIVVVGTDLTYGTGFIVKSTKCQTYIMTAYHVLRGEKECIIAFNDMTEHEGVLIKADPKRDFALILVQTGGRKEVKLSKRERANWTKVHSIGHPASLMYTRSKGYIQNNARLTKKGVAMYQLGIDIRGGASGSPVYHRGVVIGMIVSYATGLPSSSFAIQSSEIISFIKDD